MFYVFMLQAVLLLSSSLASHTCTVVILLENTFERLDFIIKESEDERVAQFIDALENLNKG